MKIIVGSTNPVKVDAVREVFQNIYGECEVVEVKVESGVDEQPRSDEETIRGARNRAQAAIAAPQAMHAGGQANFGVGIEGGVYEQGGVLMECAWCVVRHRDDREGIGGGLRFELPPIVVKKIRAGGELGPVMNKLLDREDVKKQEGAVGVLTKNEVTRMGAYKQLVNLAMIKFVSGEWWE